MRQTVATLIAAVLQCALACQEVAAQQTAATLSVGSVAVRLQRVNAISGGASANPLYGTHAPGDNRLFVVQQGTTSSNPHTPGRVRYFDPAVVDGPVGTLLDFDVALPGAIDARHFEKGLLGLAFHPQFANPASAGYLKFYTYSSERIAAHPTVDYIHPELAGSPLSDDFNIATLREWTADSPTPTSAMPSRVLMTLVDPQNQHNGGTIAFSPIDGYLYWALGDGGGNSSNSPDFVGGINNTSDGHTNSAGPGAPHGNAQDRTNPFGDMLRINPLRAADAPDPGAAPSANGQYQIPHDNPLTMSSNIDPNTSQPYPDWDPAWRDEIYAYGLRNPYRFSFDRGAAPNDPRRGTLYLNDPGYDDREEINVIVPGGNYGWVIREGTDAMQGVQGIPAYAAPVNAHTGLPDALVDPVAEYDDSIGVATIGGFVYRGDPRSTLFGMYIFGDNNASLAGLDGLLMYFDPRQEKAPDEPFTIYRLRISPLGAGAPVSGLLGFGEGRGGEVYAMFDNGQIFELLPTYAADFDEDGDVDAADLAAWRGAHGLTGAGDADGDGDSDGADFLLWQQQLGGALDLAAPGGVVPEPRSGWLIPIAAAAAALAFPRRRA